MVSSIRANLERISSVFSYIAIPIFFIDNYMADSPLIFFVIILKVIS
jgi:hypothetical protein